MGTPEVYGVGPRCSERIGVFGSRPSAMTWSIEIATSGVSGLVMGAPVRNSAVPRECDGEPA